MQKENKNNNLKISKIFIAISIVLIVFAIIFLVVGIVKYNQFEKATNDWINDSWSNPFNGFKNIPQSNYEVWFILAGIFGFSGITLLSIGLRPFFIKLSMKVNKETLEYAAKDLAETGEKVVDVIKPVYNKSVDEVIAPAVSQIVKKVKNANDEVCPNCNDKVEENEIFCSNCGTQLKKKCTNCNTVNQTKNNFCKNCGTKLN